MSLYSAVTRNGAVKRSNTFAGAYHMTPGYVLYIFLTDPLEHHVRSVRCQHLRLPEETPNSHQRFYKVRLPPPFSVYGSQ